jgi:multiple sugar transport system ATP-binding protein
MSGVEVHAIRKSFGAQEVLKGVSLGIAPGEFVSLLGPSGCGKTTLMRIIAGLETASSGRVCIGGEDVTAIRAADRDVAMVFQNYALYPHLTVRQNIAVPLAMRRLSVVQRAPLVGRFAPGSASLRAAIAADVERTARMLEIGAFLDRRPAQLSGGQRQRVALARAIVRQPLAFLMDEPLSNLDAALRVTTRAEIVALHRRVGASTIYVTHDQSEAMTMSDRVAVMMGGEILQVGTPEAIYDDPQDLRVARFIGSPAINALAAEIEADGVVRIDGAPTGVWSRQRGPVTLAVRPEDVVPAPLGGLPARVDHVEFLGESVLIHASLAASGAPILARAPPQMRKDARRGQPITLGFAPQKALLFDAHGKRLAAVTALPERAHG